MRVGVVGTRRRLSSAATAHRQGRTERERTRRSPAGVAPRSAFRRGATFPSSPVARSGRGTMTQSLGELEQLCNVMYNSHNPNERAHAEGVLGRSPRTRSTYRSARYDATRGFFSRVPTHSTTRDVGRQEGDAGRDRDEPARVSRSSRHARERRSAPASTARPPRPPGSRRARSPRSPEAARRSAFASASSTKKTNALTRLPMRTSHRHRMYTTPQAILTAPHLRTRSSSRRRRSRNCSRTSPLCPRRRAPTLARTP